MQIFLIGPSGSGKDTQAELISKKYNLKWVSIGKVLRERALIEDEEGKFIRESINSGTLLDWNYLQPVILEQLNQQNKDFIWTGFPRLYEQAIHFDELNLSKLDIVINLSLDDEKTKERIEYRKSTSETIRIDDSNDDLVQKRIEWYKNSITEIREYYSKNNRFIDVDASHDIQTVFKSICDILDKLV